MNYVIIGMATVLALTLVAAITTTTTAAFALTDPQRNNFGQGAAYIAQGGDNDVTGLMGDHASSFSGESRTGIGNFGHPADVADSLCASGGPLCP
jgi:hypothetical protein